MSLIFALDNGSILGGRPPARHPSFSWWGLGLFIILFTSCNSKKYLIGDQSFLYDNTIKISSDDKVDDAADLKEKLMTLYRQRETRTVVGIPRHVFYYRYQESLVKRPNRKRWSEEKIIKNKPVIYDSIQTDKTTEDFERYLNLRGYRSADATYKAKTTDKQTTVFYLVDPGPRIYIDSMITVANDTALQKIVNENIKETFLPAGSPLDIELYNKEKGRLAGLFQNEGYAKFDATYIAPLEVDTSVNRVKATMRILNENDSTLHKKYYVDDVTIYPNYQLTDTSFLFDTLIRNVLYISPETELTLKPEAIERNLFLHHGDLTRIDNLNQTVKNLNRMDLIRFVTYNAEVDTTQIDTHKIDYTLYLTRSKKISFDANAELTYANISSQNRRSLVGASVGANYRDLNLLKGAEVFGLNGELGFEFNYLTDDETAENNFLNSLNIALGTNLTFPRFMDPFKLYHIIGHRRDDDQPALMGNKLRRWLLYDAITRLNLSGNYVTIRDLYDYYAINAGLSYVINPDAFRNLTINRIGFDLFVPTPSDRFKTEVLDKSKFQQESFGKYLFTGFLFRGYSFQLDNPEKRKGSSFKLDHSFELSGLEMWAINALTSKDHEIALGNDDPATPESELIEFSHFAKAEINARYFYNFNSNIQLALRINPGYARPFSRFSQQVPYIKQFFVGGALSNRGWQIRELGPGGYRDTFAENTSFAYYQTGDIKLDISMELRFPLFWYFKGAVFLDAGNVWTLKEDPSRPGSQFLFNTFSKQLGVSYGFGFRLDLDFFIIRLDLGYKLISPYVLPNGKKLYEQKFPGGYIDGEGRRKGPELQIAVGLPFD